MASLTTIPSELLSQIYNSLSTISDVINLSLTSHHFNHHLRSSNRLPTLFAAAEREFGPLEDITQLLTYNASQLAHIKRKPQQSYALLRQMIRVGAVAKKIEELYPARRWADNYLERRSLTIDESWRLRRAVYRYWLYCEAFQNRNYMRSTRQIPQIVEERAQLLRSWTTEELIEIEDLRTILENIVSDDLCPTDGAAQRSFNQHCDFSGVRYNHLHQPYNQFRSWNSWPPDAYTNQALAQSRPSTSSLFHNHFSDLKRQSSADLPIPQRRKLEMTGWGDEISQYYTIQSVMKLNPAQILHMHENAVTRLDVESYITNHCDGGEWFWDNGQTWLDTWSLVLYKRGEAPADVRGAVLDGEAGITSAEGRAWLGGDDGVEGRVCS
ncbi:hypothetical protein PMZ80_009536 [Knufia obscura]|uniref:F-box domain-containing protein n=2 Tax=Knufia obscura TaxID=1635080 RepID=A0ABR0RBI3_9EURO|nr:hypothetical protein PMZ80_009536 [Knufia obscura]